MSVNQKPLLEISQKDLEKFLDAAEDYLSYDVHSDTSSARENLQAAKELTDTIDVDTYIKRAPDNMPGERVKYGSVTSRRSEVADLKQTQSIFGIADRLSPGRLIVAEPINHTVSAIRTGITLGMHVVDLYSQASGLDMLRQEKKLERLSEDGRFELREKERTAAAIQAFVTSFYVSWTLINYESENLERIKLICENDPELDLHNPRTATESIVEDLVTCLMMPTVTDEWSFVKMTLEHFRSVLDELQPVLDSLKHADSYTRNSYKVSGSEFTIEGFEFDLTHIIEQLDVRPIFFDDIVGNEDAIYESRRMCGWLMCYVFSKQMNPILEIGGFPNIRMGMGVPGTGKSMMIAAVINRCRELAQQISVPFIANPFPEDVVSKYQGETVSRALKWFKVFENRSKLIYGYLDDAENVLKDRTMDVSEGVEAVIGVFLRHTEGANAVMVGNAFMDIMTNIPENIDKAVLSRITKRFSIDGATRVEHWQAQDQMWLSHFVDIDPDLVDMVVEDGITWSAEKSQAFLEEKYASLERPTNDQLERIFNNVYERFSGKGRAPEYHTRFFAELDQDLSAQYPFYRNRDKRNIQTAIDNRIMDFFIPDEWFEHPDRYYFGVPEGESEYQTKKDMILELVRANLGGKSFGQIWLQEAVNYFENLIKIEDAEFQRKIDDEVERQIVFMEAGIVVKEKELSLVRGE